MNVANALQRLRQKHHEARTDARMHRRGYLEWRARMQEHGITPAGLRVLEVGCGDRAPLSLQFATDGAKVDAVDIRPVALGWRRPVMWWGLLRSHGPREAIRCVVIDLFHTGRYWATLRELAGGLEVRRVTVRQADAAALPFADASFDLVVSSAVWEHLPDVPTATREVRRVLRPGGLAVIQIALFPALQGGHQSEWHTTQTRPRTIRPWDHLREGRRPHPLYLNELRESDYRSAIDPVFGSTEWVDSPFAGIEYLTPDLRAEIADYSERDLLLPAITVWCR